MRILLPVVVVALLASAVIAAEPVSGFDEANPRFLLAGEADSAIATGRYDEAAARLREAISICPDCPDNALLLSNLGMAYAYAGRDSLALSTLDSALRLAPNLRTAKSNRARVLLNMGRDAEALDAFSDLLRVDSLNMEARYYHGLLALYSGDLTAAEADLTVLRDSLPDDLLTARALSALYIRTGRNAQAVPYFCKLVGEEPQPEYYAALASCYLADKKLTEASEVLGEAFAKYPDDGELFMCRSWLNRLLFRPSEAEADARMAERLGIPRARIERLPAD